MSDTTFDQLRVLVCVGKLTICWAYIENFLDIIITFIFKSLNGNQIETEIPRSLSRKLDFMKLAAKQIPIFGPLKDEIIALVEKLEAAAVTRHDLIHGVMDVEGLMDSEFEKKEIRIRRLIRKENLHRNVAFSMDELLKHVSSAEVLTEQVLAMINSILNAIKEKTPKRA
ncbi:MAG: hypothetical protein V1721_08075 [Pseudomonadota bacterium]